MLDLLKWLISELVTIGTSPGAFLIGVGVGGVSVWVGMKTLLNVSEQRLKLKDEQILDLKHKIDSHVAQINRAPPDDLEAKVASLLPRRLHIDQIKDLQRWAIQKIGSVNIATDLGHADSQLIADDFASVFANGRWEIQRSAALGGPPPPPTGVAVRVRDTTKLTDLQTSFMAALDRAKIEFDLQNLEDPFNIDLNIFLTRKRQ